MYAPRGSCREQLVVSSVHHAPSTLRFATLFWILLFGVRCFVVAEEPGAAGYARVWPQTNPPKPCLTDSVTLYTVTVFSGRSLPFHG